MHWVTLTGNGRGNHAGANEVGPLGFKPSHYQWVIDWHIPYPFPENNYNYELLYKKLLTNWMFINVFIIHPCFGRNWNACTCHQVGKIILSPKYSVLPALLWKLIKDKWSQMTACEHWACLKEQKTHISWFNNTMPITQLLNIHFNTPELHALLDLLYTQQQIIYRYCSYWIF